MKKLKKYLLNKRSMFDEFSDEIIFLSENNALQKSILQFLKDNSIEATQSNLSKWLSRNKNKKSGFLNNKSKNQTKKSIKKDIEFDVFKNLKKGN